MTKIKLNGRLAAKDTDHDPKLHFFFVNILNEPRKIIERPIDHFHWIAGTKRNHHNFGVFAFFHFADKAPNFIRLKCNRLTFRAYEANDGRRIENEMFCCLIEYNLNKNVAREKCFRLALLFTFLDLKNLLGRDEDSCNAVCKAGGLNLSLKKSLYLVFVPGIRSYNVPAFFVLCFAHATSMSLIIVPSLAG